MTVATIVLAVYAYLTIQEGKKDRRKDTIERMLENAYSPIYEILRRAKFENDERSQARGKIPGFDWVVTRTELDRMREIIEKFGHYFDRKESGKLAMFLERAKYTRTGTTPYWGFSEIEMSQCFEFITRERDRLKQELDRLTLG